MQFIVGVYDEEGPPVPIPNTVVKLFSAENTWRAAARENRSTLTSSSSHTLLSMAFFCFSSILHSDPGFLPHIPCSWFFYIYNGNK